MTEANRRKSGGPKLSRSQTVTVRLDPKLRYLADIAARSQRRTLSSFIEWAIHRSLDAVSIRGDTGDSVIASELVDDLWDVDEPDRFIMLAWFNSDLLTHEEQILMKLIKETSELWSSEPGNAPASKLSIGGQYSQIDELRSKWQELKETAHAN